jgi:hypothetical protein
MDGTRRLSPCFFAFALSCFGSALPRIALAEPTASEVQVARDLFTEAEKDEDAGQYKVALEKLRRVGAVKMTPGVRFHMAHCEENLGLLVAAFADYTKAQDEARAEPGNRASRAVLDNVTAPLDVLRGRVPRLRVVVPQAVRDVHVTIDGAEVPQDAWGQLTPIDAGIHRIAASAPSRAPFDTSVTVNERDVAVVEIKLAPEIVPPPLNRNVEEVATQPHASRVGAIAATAGAVALVAGGFGAFAIAGAKQSDGRTTCATMIDCSSLRSPVRTWDALALGGWIGGAALGAFAIVLWTSHGSETRAAIAVEPHGVRLQGEF